MVITGAAGEIGRLLAHEFAEEGAELHLVDLAEGAFAVADAVGGHAHRVDVTDESAVAHLSQIGPVDVLVNGVGSWPRETIDELTAASWRRSMEINLTSAFLVTQSLLGGLRAARGVVVNIGSAVSIKGSAQLIAYATAKAGLIGFTRSLALALGTDGVRVNAVAPGLVDTPANRAAWGDEFMNNMTASRPLRRDQVPADVVGVVRFLASDAASLMTGQTLVVDGGVVVV